jgi:hypothetical protein
VVSGVGMQGTRGRIRTGLVVAMLAATGCGGTSGGAAPCPGVEARGICWEAQDGISVTRERAERVFDEAKALWGPSRPDLSGWRIQFRHSQPVVDGEAYDGYTFGTSRVIVVAPFAADCFERSAVFHELGHAWGHDHGDSRMSGEWRFIREAMEGSSWPGCDLEAQDD